MPFQLKLSKKLAIIKWLSILMFLCGLVIIISSIVVQSQQGWDFNDAITPREFKVTKNVGLALLWLCAIISIVDGVVSFLLIKCEKRCIVMMLGSSMGAVAVIVFCVGIMFSFQTGYMPKFVDTVCTEKNTPQQQPFMKRSYLDTNMLYQVDLYMCSSECPCDQAAYQKGYSGISESGLNYQGRTKTNPPKSGKLKITTTAEKGFTIWEDCWNTTRRAKEANTTVQASMDKYLLGMKVLEDKFNCSGACGPALFWFTRPITSQPKVGCLSKVTEDLAGTYIVPGYACIACSVVMLLIFIFQYTLWCDDKEDNKVTELKDDDEEK